LFIVTLLVEIISMT